MSTGNPFAAVPLQLQRTKADYFNLKSVRGSSPTTSLAADLCQNFRIDADARYVVVALPNQNGQRANILILLQPQVPHPEAFSFHVESDH